MKSRCRRLPRSIGWPSPADAETSLRMKRVRRRDTLPEVALRSEIHRLGLRYAIDRRPISSVRRRADLVFRSAKVAVFVNGCYWHACPIHGSWPRNNARWWRAKLLRNRERDQETDEILGQQGWISVRVWEHDDPKAIACSVARVVRRRRNQLGRSSVV